MKLGISRRKFITTAALLPMVGGIAAPNVARGARKYEGQTIKLQYPGGPDGQFVQRFIVEPFEKETGAKVIVDTGWVAASIAKLQAQKNDPQLDLIVFDDIGVIKTGREGLLQPLDLGAIPNAKDIPDNFVQEGKNGIGFYAFLTSISYNTAAFSSPPTSWQVLWDPKFKGKVILPSIDATSMYKILMIAAIMNGGSQTNLEPGYEALKRLKPNINSFQKNVALIAEGLRSGDAALACWRISIMKDYIAKGYPIGVTAKLKEGVFGTAGCIAIVKGHKAERTMLNEFVNYALDPTIQEQIFANTWESPTNKNAKIPADLGHISLSAAPKLISVDLDQYAKDMSSTLDRLNKVLLD